MKWSCLAVFAFGLAFPAAAQVVRYDRIDRMTDKRQMSILAPARDGRSVFGVGCDGRYTLRSFDLTASFKQLPRCCFGSTRTRR